MPGVPHLPRSRGSRMTINVRRLSIDATLAEKTPDELRAIAEGCEAAAAQLEHVADFFENARDVAIERARQCEAADFFRGAPVATPSATSLAFCTKREAA